MVATRGTDCLEAGYNIWIRIEGKIGKWRRAATSKAPALLGLLKEIKTGYQGKTERTPISPKHSRRVELNFDQTPLSYMS